MFTRLVLASLVAALGVTLPSRTDCQRWYSSVETWASAKLADWDTWQPAQRESQTVPARFGQVAWASGPSALDDAGSNRRERRDDAGDVSPVWLSANLELWLAAEISRQAELVEGSQRVVVAHGPADVPEPVVQEKTPVVSTDLSRVLPVDVFAPSEPPASSQVKTTPKFEPIELASDLDSGTAYELNRFGEAVGPDSRPSASTRPEAPRFEPLAVGEEVESGLAYELNRTSEGIGIDPLRAADASPWGPRVENVVKDARPAASSEPLPAEPTASYRPHVADSPGQAVSASAPGARIGHAVRLTRDALCAWINVLTGPALVNMSSRLSASPDGVISERSQPGHLETSQLRAGEVGRGASSGSCTSPEGASSCGSARR
jgi:hypothetical protein